MNDKNIKPFSLQWWIRVYAVSHALQFNVLVKGKWVKDQKTRRRTRWIEQRIISKYGEDG